MPSVVLRYAEENCCLIFDDFAKKYRQARIHAMRGPSRAELNAPTISSHGARRFLSLFARPLNLLGHFAGRSMARQLPAPTRISPAPATEQKHQ
jgi:hypothetical protein